MSLDEPLSLTDAFIKAKTPPPDFDIIERDKLPSMSPDSDASSDSESESGAGKKRNRQQDEDEEMDQGDTSNTNGGARADKKRARKGPEGKPHRCKAAGCGKSYTRAEHLHRHELNRKRCPSQCRPSCSHVCR